MNWTRQINGDTTLKIGRFNLRVFRRIAFKDHRDDPEPYNVMMSADFKLARQFPTIEDGQEAGIKRLKAVLQNALQEINKMEQPTTNPQKGGK